MTRGASGRPGPKAGGRAVKRGLRPEDRALWEKVTRDATPLDPALRRASDDGNDTGPVAANAPGTTSPKSGQPEATAAAAPVPARRSLRPTGTAKPSGVSVTRTARAPEPVGRPEAGLDRRNAERLRRGEREPDGRIDLHGMTAERAHRALDRRIGEALTRGERLVLVITGKGGKPRGDNKSGGDEAPFMRPSEGVLRQQVPGWLRAGPHAASIVGVFQAHARHGGAGALYVYLKKRR